MNAFAFSDIKVLDLSTSHCGRMTSMALADLGCEVVRLSDTTDKPQFTDRGKTISTFQSEEENKSFCSKKISKYADIIIEDRPEEKLLARDMVSQDGKDGVIHCWIPAYATDDLLSGIEGDELSIDAASGIHSQPFALKQKPCMTHMSVLSVTAAAYALNGILAALITRGKDGRGQDIEIVRSDVAYSIIELNALLFDDAPKCWTPFQWIASPWMKAYPCADGEFIFFHAALKKHLPRLLEAMEKQAPEATKNLKAIISSKTYEDPIGVPSVKEIRETQSRIIEVLSVHPASFWEAHLSKHGLCAAKIIDTKSWFDHQHSKETQHVVQWNDHKVPGPMLDLYNEQGHIPFATKGSENIAFHEVHDSWSKKSIATNDVLKACNDSPLDGITVIDITQVIAGPTMGRTLAELGAKVHHIENPHHKIPFFEAFHVAYQSGKTQTTIDLNTEDGVTQLWALLEELKPDVVLQNFRPGAADVMGIGESDFRKKFPDIIFAHLSAYGTRGSWGNRPGWEQNAQAVTGAQWDFGGCPDERPEIYPLPLNDLATGLFGAMGVLTALLERKNANPIQKIETSLSRTATWMQGYAFSNKTNPSRGKNALGISRFKHYYKAKDGWLFLYVEEENKQSLTSVKGLESALSSKEETLSEMFSKVTIKAWMQRVKDANIGNDVIIVPWQSMKQMLKKPRAKKTQLVHRRKHLDIGEVTETSSALIMKRTPTIRPLPPAPITSVRPPLKKPFAQYLSWFKYQAVGFLAILANK